MTPCAHCRRIPDSLAQSTCAGCGAPLLAQYDPFLHELDDRSRAVTMQMERMLLGFDDPPPSHRAYDDVWETNDEGVVEWLVLNGEVLPTPVLTTPLPKRKKSRSFFRDFLIGSWG